MNTPFTVLENHKLKHTAYLKTLTSDDLPAMIALQDQICATLSDPQTYVASTKEEMLDELVQFPTHTLGIVTDTDQLIALGIYKAVGDSPHNYGCDYGLSGNILHTIGHVDTTIVDVSFRGNKLQQQLILAIEALAKAEGKKILCATVSPYNPYSLNSFLQLGFTIKADKLKYGGVRRYVLAKNIG